MLRIETATGHDGPGHSFVAMLSTDAGRGRFCDDGRLPLSASQFDEIVIKGPRRYAGGLPMRYCSGPSPADFRKAFAAASPRGSSFRNFTTCECVQPSCSATECVLP